MKSNEQVHCYFLENTDSSGEHKSILNAAYLSWKKSWFELFETMGGNEHCSSDEFSRQNYHLLLYLNNELAGSIGFREVDLCTDIGKDDSYLRPWPFEFKQQYKNQKILLMSGFNLSSKFRGRFMRLPSMFVFGTFIMKQFLRSSNNILITIARNDAGVNKFCASFGADKVGFAQDFHGKECDLMAFSKDKVKLYPLKKMEDLLSDIDIQNFETNIQKFPIGA